jgi:GTP-binding protein
MVKYQVANKAKKSQNMSLISPITLRNVAIIAHVDHGKTTLVDAMLKQTATFAAHQKEIDQTTILDSNELERERGVTILAKNTAVFWHDYKINILDTPGHSDFSGEVERVLNMADGCILLVDAAEGVLSQTRFVLRLALKLGLSPIVLINKVDRKDQRVVEVENEVSDLFLDIATDEEQLNFPVLYARGVEGIAGFKIQEQPDHSLVITDSKDLTPLFETIVSRILNPEASLQKKFSQDNHLTDSKVLQLQVNSLDWDNHIGKISIGRVFCGVVKKGQKVAIVRENDEKIEYATIEHLFTHQGLGRVAVNEVSAGDIVALSGIAKPRIGDTLSDPTNPRALPEISISEPTLKMKMSVNTSPFVGKEAKFSTSRQLRDRLAKEIETNVGLRVIQDGSGESVTLIGRGELHLSILIETMRREGYEFSISRPEVVYKKINGGDASVDLDQSNEALAEPWEYVVIEVPELHTGTISTTMALRFAQLLNMQKIQQDVRFEYEISTHNLIGLRTELLTSTSGAAVVHSNFLEYRPLSTHTSNVRGGAVISQDMGTATSYSINKVQQRAVVMVSPGEEVYPGQVIGINSRQEEMVVNIVRGKKLTNMRTTSSDGVIMVTPAWKPFLEEFLTLIAEDEMLEVTPKNLRLRKQKFPK